MILFFIVLPEAIALPHGTIYTFSLGTPVPEIAEVPMYQTRELGPLPYQGELFVSLRFWRRRGEYLEVKEEIEAALEVMRAAVPADELP